MAGTAWPALSGPGCNLLLALLCCRQPWGRLFAGLSLALGCFNLLPVGRWTGDGPCMPGWAAAFGPGVAGTSAAGWRAWPGRRWQLPGSAFSAWAET